MEQHHRERKKNGAKRLQAGAERAVRGRQRLSTEGRAAAGPGIAEASLESSLVPRRRQERSKAKTQLQSETLGLHSSHPLKCLVAALRNCCSKVYFQHRNKQCESMTPFPRNGTQKCNTNRKLSTVVL